MLGSTRRPDVAGRALFRGARRSGGAVSATREVEPWSARHSEMNADPLGGANVYPVAWCGHLGCAHACAPMTSRTGVMAHRLYLHIHQPTLGDPLCRGHASVWCGAACGFGNAMQVQESSLKQRLWFIPGPPASLATRQRGARALRARAARAPRPFQPALRRDWHALPLRKRGPRLCSFSSGSHCRK